MTAGRYSRCLVLALVACGAWHVARGRGAAERARRWPHHHHRRRAGDVDVAFLALLAARASEPPRLITPPPTPKPPQEGEGGWVAFVGIGTAL